MNKGRLKKSVVDYGLTITVAISIALLVRGFFFESYRIPSEVMIPTLLPGDFILAKRLDSTASIRRGDIVVYSPPSDIHKTYIKSSNY